MQWTGLNELREKYLSFFESKGHLRLDSFPLVPKNDPSLLLINSGMAPMKKWFLAQEEPPLIRASRASKVAGAFLVLFWHAKENIPGGDAFCKRHQTLNTRPRFAREALRHFPTQKRSNTCSITASEAFSPVRSHRAASASSTQTETASSPKPPAAASSAPATASRARSAAES